jgi:lysophospholipase L1-like esterase
MMQNPHGTRRAVGRLAVLLVWFLAATGPVSASYIDTYIALGDGVAFGQTNTLTPSFGDQGYVKPYADWLATQNGGVRPNVINLAIPGELSTSYLGGLVPPGALRTPSANLNYTDPSQAQQAMFLAAVGSEQAQGHTVGQVSFAVGARDFGYLLNNTDFLNRPRGVQNDLFNQALALTQRNYNEALTTIRQALPNATLLLLDYYNPYGSQPAGSPLNYWGQRFANAFQNLVANEAAGFNGIVVDIAGPFAGHENDYTYTQSNDQHPTPLGYSVIAQQMILASEAPEPASLTLLGVGVLGLLGYGWRRKKA